MRSGDYPDIEEWTELYKERQRLLGKDYIRKSWPKNTIKKKSTSSDPRKSVMVRIMFLNNRYIISLLIMGFFKMVMSKIIKYQVHIGATIFIIGHIFQMIEKLIS